MPMLPGLARVLTAQRKVEHSADLVVRGSLAEVWRRLVDPQTTVAMEPTVVRAHRLGEARGKGEVHAFLHRREGGAAMLFAHEILEYEPEHRLLTAGLTFVGYYPRAEVVVEQVGQDCVRITHRWWLGFPPGTPRRQVATATEASADRARSARQRYARVFEVIGGGD